MTKQRFNMRITLLPTLQLRVDKNSTSKTPEELAGEFAERFRKTLAAKYEAQIFDIQVEEADGEWGEQV